MTLAGRLPTGRPGQLLAVAITLAFVLAIWEAALLPLVGLYEDRQDAVVVAETRAARMAAWAASLPGLREAARHASAAGPATSSLIEGNTDAVAAATLQGRVQDLAAASGVTLSSTEALAARQEGAYRRVALRVSLNATLPTLTHLLQSLAEGTPRMLVDDLQLHTSPIIVAQLRSGVPPLDASMTIIAFRAGHASDDNAADSGQADNAADAGSTP